MTLRQVIPFGSAAAAGSAIVFKARDSASATTITIPSHASGDMIIIAAEGTASVPTGWTEIKDGSYKFGTNVVVGYKVATGGSEVSGTWTGATELHVAVYDGVASIGASAFQQSTSTTIFPALTMTVTDGTSWVSAFAYACTTAPSGMTKRGTGTWITLDDTAAGTDSWTQKSVWSGSSSSAAFVIELVSE